MDFLYGETVAVLTAGSTADPYSGETAEDWDSPTEAEYTGIAVEPRPSTEPVQDARNAVTSGFTLYGLPAEAVTAKNRIRVRGVVYNVLGEPSWWRHPMTGTDFGLVVQVDRTEG